MLAMLKSASVNLFFLSENRVTKKRMPRLARTNYGVRTAAFLFCLIVIGLHLWHREAGLLWWTLLVAQFAVYPHLAWLRVKYSKHPRRAELDNLLVDALLLGAWIAALG